MANPCAVLAWVHGAMLPAAYRNSAWVGTSDFVTVRAEWLRVDQSNFSRIGKIGGPWLGKGALTEIPVDLIWARHRVPVKTRRDL